MTQTPRRPRELRPGTFAILYRCPETLAKRIDYARYELHERTRSALITKAITEYLTKRGFPEKRRSA